MNQETKFFNCFSNIRFTFVLLGLACLVQSAEAQPHYNITDLGTFGGSKSAAQGINSSGQVVGSAYTAGNAALHAFRTAANSAIKPATDDLGTFGGTVSSAAGINSSGQVVGFAFTAGDAIYHAFRTAANSAINSATDDLGTFGGSLSFAAGINSSGQVVGSAYTAGDAAYHAFRTLANSTINPATDDLGTFGGSQSVAVGINSSGQVVGYAYLAGDAAYHAFRTAANSAINPTTDDLGTFGGSLSLAFGINSSGEVVGSALTPGNTASHGFLYTGGVLYDLNNLIPAGSGWSELTLANALNDAGQIVGEGTHNGESHAFRLDPVLQALIQQPINSDGTSVFNASRGVIPVRFSLTQGGQPTCNLPPATISLKRTAGGTVGNIDESVYVGSADTGSQFRIDGCQYVYNLQASSLGPGSYLLGIAINGGTAGTATFGLK